MILILDLQMNLVQHTNSEKIPTWRKYAGAYDIRAARDQQHALQKCIRFRLAHMVRYTFKAVHLREEALQKFQMTGHVSCSSFSTPFFSQLVQQIFSGNFCAQKTSAGAHGLAAGNKSHTVWRSSCVC